MQLRQLIAYNQVFALLAKLLEGGKSVLFALAVVSFYSTTEFGVFSLTIAIGSVLAIVAEFRLMGVLIRLFSSYPSLQQRLLSHAMRINLVFALLGILLIGSSFFIVDSLLFQCLIIFSLSFLYKFARSIRALLIANQKNSRIAIAEVTSGSVMLISFAIAVFYQADLPTLVFIRTVDFLLVSFLFIGFANISLPAIAKVRYSARLTGFLIKKSLPLVLSGAAMILFQRVDLIFINAFLNTELTGIYAAATTIASVFSIAAIVFSESLAPQLFKNTQGGSDAEFGRLLLVVGALMSVLCFFSSGLIVHYLLGTEYQAAHLSLQILSLSPFFIALGAFAGQVIIKRRLEQHVFKKSLAACVLTILLDLLLIPILGIEGGAIATVCGLLFANYLSHWWIKPLRPVFQLQNSVIVQRSEPAQELKR